MKHQTILRNMALALFVTAVSAFALSAGRDKVKVQFEHPVHVNNQVLPPGHYTIEEMGGKGEQQQRSRDLYGWRTEV